MGFEKSGDYLAVGDRGGRVVIFERKDGKYVRINHTIGVWGDFFSRLLRWHIAIGANKSNVSSSRYM